MEKEQITKATIGEGRIIINGEEATEEELKELNRDLDKTQEITKDIKTGGLDAEITINDKWITDPLGQFKNIGYIFEEGWHLTSGAIEQVARIISNVFGVDTEEIIKNLPFPEDVRNKIREAVKRDRIKKKEDIVKMAEKIVDADYDKRAQTTSEELDKAVRLNIIDTVPSEERQKLEKELSDEIDKKIAERQEEKGGHAVFREERDEIAREIMATHLPDSLVAEKRAKYIEKFNKANNDMVMLGPQIEEINKLLKDDTLSIQERTKLEQQRDKLSASYTKAINIYTNGLELVPTDPALVARAAEINAKLNAPEILGYLGEGKTSSIPYGEEIMNMAYRKLNAVGVTDIDVYIVDGNDYAKMVPSSNSSVAVFDRENSRIVINTDSGIYHGDNFEALNSIINHEINHAIENQVIVKYNNVMKDAKTVADQTKVFNSFSKAEQLIIGDAISITRDEISSEVSENTRSVLGIGERTSNIAGQAR